MKKIELNIGPAYVLDDTIIPSLSHPLICPKLRDVRQFANVPTNIYCFCRCDRDISGAFMFYVEPAIDYTIFVLEDKMFILPYEYDIEFDNGNTNRLFVRQLLFNIVNEFFSDLLYDGGSYEIRK